MKDELRARLTELGLTEEQISKLAENGVSDEADMAMANEQEVREWTGCTPIAAKKIVAAFAPPPTAPEPVTSAAFQSILPEIPDDRSYLEMLRVGGVLKIDRVDVISAVRAATASDMGLFELPDVLAQRMEKFALEQEEPVGEAFYRLQKQLTQRQYGDILQALGTTGTFVSDRRKRETLARINQYLWPSLRSYNGLLESWVQSWQGAANPAAMFAFMAMSTQGAHGVLPPGMLQPPDTSGLRDEGEAVVNSINKVFAGPGIAVARAMAYDAYRIREAIEDPTLPSTVGAATRDQMLKMLSLGVGADYVRLENNVARFALAIMDLPKVSTAEELAYFGAMYQLGTQIPWEKLGTDSRSSSTGARPSRRDPAYVRGDDPAMGR